MIKLTIILQLAIASAFVPPASIRPQGTKKQINLICFSLKPAASALMDSGKAFARSGEFLIDVTTEIDLYGGALSAAGAAIRNSGDCIAQAAASCRFKTGAELVCDELREGATCLSEASSKLEEAILEAEADNNEILGALIGDSIPNLNSIASSLEEAGKAVLQKKTEKEVGSNLLKCSEFMELFSQQIKSYAPDLTESKNAEQRMTLAADCMRTAAFKLTGDIPDAKKPVGKAWIKG